MARTIHFTKMHGAGNDYIYVDATLYNISDPSAAAIAWSDRHKGIGSDGLVLIGRSEMPGPTIPCVSSTPTVRKP